MDSFAFKTMVQYGQTLSIDFVVKELDQFIALLLSARSCILKRYPHGEKKKLCLFSNAERFWGQGSNPLPLCLSKDLLMQLSNAEHEESSGCVLLLPCSVSFGSCTVRSLRPCPVCGSCINFPSSTFPAQHLPFIQKSRVPLSYFTA